MLVRVSNISVSLDAMLPGKGEQLKREAAKACGISAKAISGIRVIRRSVDARKKHNVHFVLTCELELARGVKLHLAKGVQAKEIEARAADAPAADARLDEMRLAAPLQHGSAADAGQEVSQASESLRTDVSRETSSWQDGDPKIMVVGSGPAGMFCALHLARAGLQPLLIERGEAVEDRERTVSAFNSGGSLNPGSNIQFGEGGAGTFSDGKLTTGTKDSRIRTVIETFAECGAPADILIDAKPHIGTDYLPTVVRNLRQQIIDAGGRVMFDTQLVGIELAEGDVSVPAQGDSSRVRAAILQDVKSGSKTSVPIKALVLATGHSARDTFQMLDSLGIAMERKPFAMGVRIEHLQKDIDHAQYGSAAGHPVLPPADYKLNVRTNDGRGVYTFCMCPGGTVVAAASEEGGVCVNGMSSFARDGANANSALLVEIRPDDLPGEDVLEGMYFQRELEQAAYMVACDYRAPAQTVGSFLAKGAVELECAQPPSAQSQSKVRPTYPRGVVYTDLHECLPSLITDALEDALPKLDRKLHGFADPQAVMTAVEARSSSPVRILRDGKTLQSISVSNLYPAGEGAGYAGGITSAAVDGLRVAEAIVRECQLADAAEALRAGRPAIFATDTVMGIGVSVEAAPSPAILAEIKGRPSDKPIAWLVGSLDDLAEYGEDVPEYAYNMAREQWPGALTLVVKASSKVPAPFRSDSGTIGLRMPDSEGVLRLIRKAGSPLAVTSANLAGDAAPAVAADLSSDFLRNAAERSAYLMESGSPFSRAKEAIPSTVIDCTGETPKTLRSR